MPTAFHPPSDDASDNASAGDADDELSVPASSQRGARDDDDDEVQAASDDELAALLAEEDDDGSLDEDFPMGDGVADVTAEVYCPYCGEPVEIALDPGSGSQQQYVEDCQVCCQPWRVSVHYDADGHAEVQVTPEDEQ